MFSDSNIDTIWYAIIFDTLICIALAEFGVIVLYYLYKNCLYKVRLLEKFIIATTTIVLKCYHHVFKTKPIHPPSMAPLEEFEQLREELLLADSLH